jgi:hypothetical protein
MFPRFRTDDRRGPNNSSGAAISPERDIDEFPETGWSKALNPTTGGSTMPDSRPTLYVCHGDDGGPRVHPCRRVQEALRAEGIEYDKVIAAHGSPIPFLRKGSREDLREATGETKLPALKLPDGTVLTHSKAIQSWISEQAGSRAAA